MWPCWSRVRLLGLGFVSLSLPPHPPLPAAYQSRYKTQPLLQPCFPPPWHWANLWTVSQPNKSFPHKSCQSHRVSSQQQISSLSYISSSLGDSNPKVSTQRYQRYVLCWTNNQKKKNIQPVKQVGAMRQIGNHLGRNTRLQLFFHRGKELWNRSVWGSSPQFLVREPNPMPNTNSVSYVQGEMPLHTGASALRSRRPESWQPTNLPVLGNIQFGISKMSQRNKKTSMTWGKHKSCALEPTSQ